MTEYFAIHDLNEYHNIIIDARGAGRAAHENKMREDNMRKNEIIDGLKLENDELRAELKAAKSEIKTLINRLAIPSPSWLETENRKWAELYHKVSNERNELRDKVDHLEADLESAENDCRKNRVRASINANAALTAQKENMEILDKLDEIVNEHRNA